MNFENNPERFMKPNLAGFNDNHPERGPNETFYTNTNSPYWDEILEIYRGRHPQWKFRVGRIAYDNNGRIIPGRPVFRRPNKK